MPKVVRQQAPASRETEMSSARWPPMATLPRRLVESPRAETEEVGPAQTPEVRTKTLDFLTRRTRQTQVERGAAWVSQRRRPNSELYSVTEPQSSRAQERGAQVCSHQPRAAQDPATADAASEAPPRQSAVPPTTKSVTRRTAAPPGATARIAVTRLPHEVLAQPELVQVPRRARRRGWYRRRPVVALRLAAE